MQIKMEKTLNAIFYGMIVVSIFFVVNCIFQMEAYATGSEAAINFFASHDTYEFPLIVTDPTEENVFATPIAWYKDSIYVINVEPSVGPSDKMNLNTVIRKGTIKDGGRWEWTKKVIEDRTLEDRYHTQPSLAIDKNGYIHVAYNMHNMPWQYTVSEKPGEISSFIFKGEVVTDAQLHEVKIENKTNFAYLGTAAIPGTQITYPAFFTDRNGEIYVTYRFATRPKQSWSNRGFAGGIAKYDVDKKKWEPVGGELKITSEDALYPDEYRDQKYIVHPFAYEDKWSVYLINLHFDHDNNMHLTWTWREGGAGSDCSHPTYAYAAHNSVSFKKSDGSGYDLPVSFADADVIMYEGSTEKYYSSTSLSTDPDGNPYVILNPIGSFRVLVTYDRAKERWATPEKTPWGATALHVGTTGQQWAFASGINVFHRENAGEEWVQVLSGEGFGWPKITYVKGLQGFLIHALSKDCKNCKLIWLRAEDSIKTPSGLKIK